MSVYRVKIRENGLIRYYPNIINDGKHVARFVSIYKTVLFADRLFQNSHNNTHTAIIIYNVRLQKCNNIFIRYILCVT